MDADSTQFINNTVQDATTIRSSDATKTVMSGNIGFKKSKLNVVNGASFDARPDKGSSQSSKIRSIDEAVSIKFENCSFTLNLAHLNNDCQCS